MATHLRILKNYEFLEGKKLKNMGVVPKRSDLRVL